MAWCGAIVLVVAGGLALALVLRSPTGHPPLLGHSASRHRQRAIVSAPNSIVGWTANESLVVISTRTGQIERTLATNVSVFAPGDPSISVAPDGTVFFDSADAASVPARAAGGDQILSVSIKGGPVRDVASGSDPQVSPDGRTLAYIGADAIGTSGEPPYLVAPTGIDIASLSAAGTVHAVRTLRPGPAQHNRGAFDLSWSSNSKSLSFDLYDPQTTRTSAWSVANSPHVSSLAAAIPIPLHQVGLTWNGYFGTRGNGDLQGLGVLTSPSGAQQTVVTIDAKFGRVTRKLFSVPAAVCTLISPTRPGECSSDFTNPLTGDPTSSSVLVAGAIPGLHGTPTPLGASSLYLWHRSLDQPILVASHVVVASWGPPRSQ